MPDYPATFRVQSWVKTNNLITGCVVKCWRGQSLPVLTGLVALLGNIIAALTGFNPFGAASAGTAFTCIAVQRSDT